MLHLFHYEKRFRLSHCGKRVALDKVAFRPGSDAIAPLGKCRGYQWKCSIITAALTVIRAAWSA